MTPPIWLQKWYMPSLRSKPGTEPRKKGSPPFVPADGVLPQDAMDTAPIQVAPMSPQETAGAGEGNRTSYAAWEAAYEPGSPPHAGEPDGDGLRRTSRKDAEA